MILRLVAVRLAYVVVVAGGVLAVVGGVVGLDQCLTRWWPSLGPANGLVFSLTAPWAVVVLALLLAPLGRLTDRVGLPDGLGRTSTR